MKKVYIIGNGFDLWHGLPTGYDHFYAFANEMLDEVDNYYSFDLAHAGPWCDFENSLGCFDWHQFYEAHNHIDVASEKFRPSEVYGLEDDITEQTDHHVTAIRESFLKWVDGIDVSVAIKKIVFPHNAIFITFNYTSTLQAVYGINDENVFHLHGRSDDFDELVFGHGESMEEEAEFDENGDSNRTMFSDAESAAKYPFHAFRKPVSDVLDKYQKLFDSIGLVNEIVVIGHSLNKIDLPYFQKLALGAPNARWQVFCYKNSDKAHYVQELLNCGVQRESVRTCTYEELEAEHCIEHT